MQLTADYPTLRAGFFAAQTSLFVIVSLLLAVYIGGRSGRSALLLWPLSLSAFPLLHSLQYGQVHVSIIALSILGLLALGSGRAHLGAGCLAAATVGKLFPGVLILWLLGRRQYADVARVAAYAAGLWALSIWAFGATPTAAFFGYHLPRLQSGAAFAFGDAWPELADLVLAANHGVYGLTLKLQSLGLPAMDRTVAALFNRLCGMALALAAVYAGYRSRESARSHQAQTWLALLGLGSLLSTGAFADYVPLTATWLLTLLAVQLQKPLEFLTVGVVWFAQYTLAFTTPIGDWFDPAVMLPVSALSAASLLGLLLWTLRTTLSAAASSKPSAHRERAARVSAVPS